jgi:hypothetical protein
MSHAAIRDALLAFWVFIGILAVGGMALQAATWARERWLTKAERRDGRAKR